MMRVSSFLFGACLLALPALILPAGANDYVETPNLEARVSAGELPPVAERVPGEPRVIDLEAMGREPGVHGGRIRMLMGDQKDIRLMTLFGYARFVGYDL